MKVKILLQLLFVIGLQQTLAYKEIIGILDQATDLTSEEKNLLQPIFHDLQTTYDFLVKVKTEKEIVPSNQEKNEYDEVMTLFKESLGQMVVAPVVYNTELPTIDELIGTPNTANFTIEELSEYLDVRSILEESLDDAKLYMNEIAEKSLALERQLLKLDKHKLVEYIYNGLSFVFHIAVGVSRAAYCTYSNIPQLNTSLHHLYDGVDCYLYSLNLIMQVQNETIQTLNSIRNNVLDLTKVYKKVANKHSILGKIMTMLLNLNKVLRDVRDTYSIATSANNRLRQELPNAAKNSISCGLDFASKIPFMIESVTNVTTCIMFVDDTTQSYDFMGPEE